MSHLFVPFQKWAVPPDCRTNPMLGSWILSDLFMPLFSNYSISSQFYSSRPFSPSGHLRFSIAVRHSFSSLNFFSKILKSMVRFKKKTFPFLFSKTNKNAFCRGSVWSLNESPLSLSRVFLLLFCLAFDVWIAALASFSSWWCYTVLLPADRFWCLISSESFLLLSLLYTCLTPFFLFYILIPILMTMPFACTYTLDTTLGEKKVFANLVPRNLYLPLSLFISQTCRSNPKVSYLISFCSGFSHRSQYGN